MSVVTFRQPRIAPAKTVSTAFFVQLFEFAQVCDALKRLVSDESTDTRPK
jgi:hypothetical protein